MSAGASTSRYEIAKDDILWDSIANLPHSVEFMTNHVPVLPDECMELLAIKSGQTIVDGTMGGGGHTRLIAELVGETGLVIALDRDPAAVEAAAKAGLPSNVKIIHESYFDLPDVLVQLEITSVNGVLLDLGLSSDQLNDGDRGFSYHAEGELDLRFNPDEGRPAWEMIHYMREPDIADLIYKYGEERFSRRIARRIVEARKSGPIRSAPQMADLVRSCVPRSRGHNIDPATRTFQALRIAVNDELGGLERALDRITSILAPDGRLVVISFHSLEDRIVKHFFRNDARLEILTKKPLTATDTELRTNPRSRSAKLRGAKRIV